MIPSKNNKEKGFELKLIQVRFGSRFALFVVFKTLPVETCHPTS